MSILFAEPKQGAPLDNANWSMAGASSVSISVWMKEVQEEEPVRFGIGSSMQYFWK